MRNTKLLKSIIAVFLMSGCFLFAGNPAYSQDDYEDEDEIEASEELGEVETEDDEEAPAQRTEIEWYEYLMNKSNNQPFNPFVAEKDPFKALVEKKVIQPPPPPKRSGGNDKKPDPKLEPKVKIQPLKLNVTGIVGNDDQRIAIVSMGNEEYTVTKEQIVDGKFKVIDIQPDRVTIYDNKAQQRRSFKIGGEDK